MGSVQDAVRQVGLSELADSIGQAEKRLQGKVIRTAVTKFALPWLDISVDELDVWAKLECHQHTGSFKYRGALNAALQSPAKTIVTASAGNHALAICAAARQTGKKSHVVAPIGVSEIKAKRILNEADELTFYGKDLYEATLNAEDRAAAIGAEYISPYADPRVVAGAGTMIVEAFEDAGGSFDAIIIPLGGGGLAAAAAAWCSVHSPHTRIIAAVPSIFARDAQKCDMTVSGMLHNPVAPSICDGLAVQVVRTTPLASILDHGVKQLVQVDENDVRMAIGKALRFHSLLLEGAAAAAIVALEQERASLRGRVLLLLSGQNVSPSTVASALTQYVESASLRQQMGLRNVMSPADRLIFKQSQRRYQSVNDVNQSNIHNGIKHVQESQDIDIVVEPKEKCGLSTWRTLLQNQVKGLQEKLQMASGIHAQRQLVSSSLKLSTDPGCINTADQLFSLATKLAADLLSVLSSSEDVPLHIAEGRYRLLLKVSAAYSTLFDRASPSFDQSLVEWFSDPASQNSSMVNYDRYGTIELRAAESIFLQTIKPSSNPGTKPPTVLLTSSGMAAFQIILQLLLRLIPPSSPILLAPYIYFEASEQISELSTHPGSTFTLHRTPNFSISELISLAESLNARAIFLDPIANVAGLPTLDIRDFATQISGRPGWSSRVVVIDGTMISGGLPVLDYFNFPDAPQVLYWESASKYLQLGLDLQMAGVCILPSTYEAVARKIRRDLGATMYSQGIALLPSLGFESYQTHMQLLTRNTETLVAMLKREIDACTATIAFPERWREMGWRHGGGVLTVEFVRKGLNQREGLDACIEMVLMRARQRGLGMTKGVSFGFTTARISASSSMAENTDPFLRVSVGLEAEDLEVLADVLVGGIAAYVEAFDGEEQTML